MSGVYIHIPFCARKCAYCDFASWPGRQADWQRYVRAVEEEIRAVGGGPAETVFFGGGTPSLLPAEWLCGLLDAVRETFALAADAEITLEANPGTISPDSLALYRQAGVNRISFGAQSANDALLRAIGRIHTWMQVEEAVRMAQDVGLENINLDLMYGLPGQTVQDVKTALLRAMALGVRHISCYNLIVEPGTPLARGVERGEIRLPEEDAQAEMQRAVCDTLRKGGFERYEISNYALPGWECCHNINYWLRGDYFGFGCAAHSLVAGVRYANPDSLDEYLRGARQTYRETLTEADGRLETVMLGTRTRWGADISYMKANALEPLVRSGFARICAGKLVLTDAGWEVHNAILRQILS